MSSVTSSWLSRLLAAITFAVGAYVAFAPPKSRLSLGFGIGMMLVAAAAFIWPDAVAALRRRR